MAKNSYKLIGHFKVALHQSAFIISICNMGMIGYLFLEKRGWSWWYLIVPVAIGLYNMFYFKYLRPREMTSNWEASPPMMRLQDNVEEIKCLLKGDESGRRN